MLCVNKNPFGHGPNPALSKNNKKNESQKNCLQVSIGRAGLSAVLKPLSCRCSASFPWQRMDVAAGPLPRFSRNVVGWLEDRTPAMEEIELNVFLTEPPCKGGNFSFMEIFAFAILKGLDQISKE